MKNIAIRLINVLRFAVTDFKSKYAGSALGVLWAIAEPLITIIVYRFVYTVAFGGEDICGISYYLWLSVGLSVWMFVSDGLKNVCLSFREYSFLVKKMRFDKRVLPDVRCISSLFSHLIFLSVVILLAMNYISAVGLLKLFIMVIMCYAYIIALGRILALLCVYCKDVQNILGVVLNIGFWITPVFWSAENLDAEIKRIIELNPVALLTEGYRSALLFGKFIELDKFIYLISATTVVFVISLLLEKFMLPNIADKL